MSPAALAAGGWDTSAGAGVAADLRAIQAQGVRGLGAIAAITAQSDRRVARIFAVPEAEFAAQLEVLVRDHRPRAVKTGMLFTAGHVGALLGVLDACHWQGPIVVDPVARATSGMPLWQEGGWEALASALVPRAALITPNAEELALLAAALDVGKEEAPASPGQAQALARKVAQAAGVPVLAKGGHVEGDEVVDWLVWPDGRTAGFAHARRQSLGRGTGCRLAAAIAARLAQGEDMEHACAQAIAWLAGARPRVFAR